MATIVAVRSGNWSDTDDTTGPWPGTTPCAKPAVGDTVQTREHIITIDEDVHVALLEATSSGYFQITSAPALPAVRTITAPVINSGSEGGAMKISNPTGLVMWAGAASGGSDKNAYGIYNVGGTIGDVTGDITGGAGNDASGIYNNGGTIGNVTGDVTGGAGNNACGIYGFVAYIEGDVSASAGAYGVYSPSGNVTVDGSLICGPNGLFPIYGPFRMVANPANAITVISSTDTPLTLSNDYPAEADVKSGVEYNRGTMTGELAAGGNIGPVSIVIGGGGIRIS